MLCLKYDPVVEVLSCFTLCQQIPIKESQGFRHKNISDANVLGVSLSKYIIMSDYELKAIHVCNII